MASDTDLGATQLTVCTAYFADLRKWLDDAKLPDKGASPVYLYCDSQWAQRQDPNDLAWAARPSPDDPLPDINDPNADNDPKLEHATRIGEDGQVVPLRINEVPKYVKEMAKSIKRVPSGGSFNPVPYWSKDAREYLFEDDWPGGSYCNKPEHQGGTDSGTLPNIVTLCPRAFQHGTATLGSGNPGVGSWISEASNVMPRSITLLHELGHLVQGQGHTSDYASKSRLG